jgi:cytochrome c1
MSRRSCTAIVASAFLWLACGAAFAAEAPLITRQKWTFGGPFGRFDDAQLQRGFKVYKEVCATCHGLKRVSFRHLAEPGGPNFPEAGVKSLAASYEVEDGPNDQGKMFKRPGRLTDAIPSPYRNEQEARAVHNGAYPPDLSVIVKARAAEPDRPFYLVPLAVLRDVFTGYQESGADYLYALLTSYAEKPANVTLAEGMHYNTVFPGHQIAMVNPFAPGDGMVKYDDDTPGTVDNYARDVVAFLAWAADPKLEERKRLGLLVMLYLIVTAVLFYLAKKRVWSQIGH